MKTLKGALAYLFVIVSAGLLFGQGGGNAAILGTVTDNTGAVVANAKVEVTNKSTGIVTRTETTSSGDYTVPLSTQALTSSRLRPRGSRRR